MSGNLSEFSFETNFEATEGGGYLARGVSIERSILSMKPYGHEL